MPFRHLFLLTDIEGVAGVTCFRQTRQAGGALVEARRLATEEVNAVVAGLHSGAGGSTLQVSVWDGHGPGGLDLDRLDPGCQTFPHDLEGGFAAVLAALRAEPVPVDGLVFVGQHAMEGSGGNLAHTYSSRRVREHRLNDVPIGEFGTRALHAWELGVPTIFLSGDDVTCAEARALVPGIETVAVKRARGLEDAESLPGEEARARLREAAARLCDETPDAARWCPRVDLVPPFVYTQRFKRKWGIVPRPTRVIRGERLVDVLAKV